MEKRKEEKKEEGRKGSHSYMARANHMPDTFMLFSSLLFGHRSSCLFISPFPTRLYSSMWTFLIIQTSPGATEIKLLECKSICLFLNLVLILIQEVTCLLSQKKKKNN